MKQAKQDVAIFIGIDVGAEQLHLVRRSAGQSSNPQSFFNRPRDRQRLAKKLAKVPNLIVCLEATGVYHQDLALALHDAGVRVMVLNPKVAHNFAKVLRRDSKTDPLDADTLAQYAERMPFAPWARPSTPALQLRALSRRIETLTSEKAAAKNQLHALGFSVETPKSVLSDVRQGIQQLEQRIGALSKEALALIRAHPALEQRYQLLVSIKGIAQTSAIALLGELLMLPAGLTHKQWVKFAGLYPRQSDSGKSVHKAPRLSKAGNRYIRKAMYMPALSAKTHDPYVKAYFEHLIAAGKKPLQAVCAVMRKLLHAIHGMFKNNQPFDNTRFYALSA
jgi:transposase